MLWIAFFFRTAARIGGAFLLSTALIAQAEGGYAWDNGRLVVGGILLFISVILMRSRGGSSSTSSSSSDSSRRR